MLRWRWALVEHVTEAMGNSLNVKVSPSASYQEVLDGCMHYW